MKYRVLVSNIRSCRPCREEWRKFKKAYPKARTVTLRQILSSNGVYGLWWVLVMRTGCREARVHAYHNKFLRRGWRTLEEAFAWVEKFERDWNKLYVQQTDL